MKHVLLSLLSLFVAPLAALPADDAPSVKSMIGSLPAAKVLFLGSSITLHAPAPQIGWTGNWSMAASAEEKDCVHLLTAEIAKAVAAAPRTMVRNVAALGREAVHAASSERKIEHAGVVGHPGDKGMRAMVAKADGTGRQEIAGELASAADTSTQFAGWSPDGAWLVYGSKREGLRQLYVMRLANRVEKRITNLAPGHAAMWPHWQPVNSTAGP